MPALRSAPRISGLPIPVGTRTRLAAEIRRDIGDCEQRRRMDYAAHDDIRTMQGQRRIMRPNL